MNPGFESVHGDYENIKSEILRPSVFSIDNERKDGMDSKALRCSICKSAIALLSKELNGSMEWRPNVEGVDTYMEGKTCKAYYVVHLSALKTEAAKSCEACEVVHSAVEPYQLSDEVRVRVAMWPIVDFKRRTKQLRITVEFSKPSPVHNYTNLEVFKSHSEFPFQNCHNWCRY